MATIISVVNQKGGVGKTTTSVNLAACLALAGHSTLLVDIDPQGNATSGAGIPQGSLTKSIFDALVGESPAEDTIMETAIPNLWIAPANMDLSGAEMSLLDRPDRLFRLKTVLEPLKSKFSFIVIDSPPSLSILALNVFAAAHKAIVPVQCEYYALEGLTSLLATFRRVREKINPGIRIMGVLMTMYDRRTNLSQQVIDEVRRVFGSLVFNTMIPRSVKLSEAPSFGKPVIIYDVRSPGAEAYIRMCEEVLDRVKEESIGPGVGCAAGIVGPGAGAPSPAGA